MNIENHIYNAKKALDMVRDKVESQDYDTALAMLCNLMTENRELIEHVYKLHALKAEVSTPAGEDTG
jgi:hypothetical protein